MQRIFPATVFLLSAALHSTHACVGCREPGVIGPDEPQTLMAGAAFSWSVLTMLVTVFLIIGGLTMYIVRTCQRLDLEKNMP